MGRLGFHLFTAWLVVALASAVGAREVGTIASVDGTAEIGREDRWGPAGIGEPIHLGDALRTARHGRLRVVFQDDSVLSIGDSSFVIVDEQTFDPEGGSRSLMKLIEGKVRALVSEYYERHGAVYEIETATAVSGVRGTEFVVTHDPEQVVTEVIAVHGRVEVHSVLDRAARGVFITAGEITTVAEGQFPTRPPRPEEDRFRQYLEGLEFIGAGRLESLTAGHPVLSGIEVPSPDQAPSAVLADRPDEDRGNPTAASLVDQPLDELTTGDLGVRF